MVSVAAAATGKMFHLVILCALTALAVCENPSDTVLELDDSFMERRGENAWLVKFYAPWCGHCRRLEPIWYQVNQAMKTSDIRVAKVDATRFGSIASAYDVKGYPSIKFIEGDRVLTYRGDRVRDAILEFAKRAHGPLIRWLSNMGKFNDMKSDHSSGVFFIYIGTNDESSDFLRMYTDIADTYRVQSYFYAGSKIVLPLEYKIKSEPTVLVIKDGKYYEYNPPDGITTKESLDDFINSERLLAFPKISSGGMGELAGLNKKVVMVVTKYSIDSDPKQERLKQLGKMLATTHREKYHQHFQFLWMDDPETANTIMMSRPDTPYIIALEMGTQYYYVPDQGFETDSFTIDEAHVFLEKIVKGQAEALGGTGLLQRVKRLFYDIIITVYGIYDESPWLALLVFGVPSLVISIVCYALCCMEPIDEEAFYEELAEEARAAEAEKERILEAEQENPDEETQLRKRTVAPGDETQDESHFKKE